MIEVAQIANENRALTIAAASDGSVLEVARSLSQPATVATNRQGSHAAESPMADILDRSLHAAIARFTGGLSPAALSAAYLDWASHLANAPGKRLQLTQKAVRKGPRRRANNCP